MERPPDLGIGITAQKRYVTHVEVFAVEMGRKVRKKTRTTLEWRSLLRSKIAAERASLGVNGTGQAFELNGVQSTRTLAQRKHCA